MNINGLITLSNKIKLSKLESWLNFHNAIFMGLTETHLNNNVLDGEIQINGYNCYRSDRSDRSHGGVCIYIDNSLKSTVIASISNDICEAIIVNVKELEMYIVVVYRPPNCKVEKFEEIMKHIDDTLVSDSDSKKF